MNIKRQNDITRWAVAVCIIAACFMACTVSCTKKNYETAVPLSVSEAQQAEETDDTGEACESTDELEKFCHANQDAILCPVVVTQTKFGKRHEIQGDLREGRWATIEPTLQAPNLETSPGQHLIQAFKSNLNLYCSPNSSSDMLIYCSKSGKNDSEAEDDDYNEMEYADYVYLCSKDSTTNARRCYEIESNFEYGDWESGNSVTDISLIVVDVETRTFMDTSGLYIRTKKREDCNTEIAPGFRDYIKTTYTTWLFAGDNRRLVTHWVDTNYEYSFEQQDIYSDSEDGEYIRIDIDLSESY